MSRSSFPPTAAALLAALRASARELDPARRVTAPPASPSDDETLRYLRDPSVRHWVAQERGIIDERIRGQVFGHLVAHIHHRYAGPPAMVVVEVGVRAEHRGGLVGMMLVAAMCDEAAMLEIDEIVAIADDPALGRYLRGLGFRRPPRRRRLLTLPA